MSITSGLLSGLRSGVRSGLNPSLGGLAGVAQDATSGIYAPANDGQWTTTMSSAGIGSGNPASLWLCQEAAGNLADSIGANTLTAFGAPHYNVVIPGWARTGLHLHSGDAFFSTTIGNTATTSYVLIAYIAVDTAAAAVTMSVGGGAASADVRNAALTVAPVYRAQGSGVVAVNGTSNPGTSVRPVVILFNRAATEFSVLTDQDKITTAWVNPTDGTSAYLSLGDGAAALHVLYAALFSGAAAQLTRTQIKTLLTTLGWSIGWTP